MPSYDALFQPIRLNQLTLKNRILSTAHEPSYAIDGRPGLDYQLYHEEKAKGGAVHLANLYRAGVRLTPDQRLLEVKPIGNRLRATLVNEYTGMTTERSVGQVVVERGPLAVDELYHELVDDSRNRGEVGPAALASGDLEMPERNPGADYWLIRIGDSLASRNIHAAIHDALRACKDLQPPDGVFRRS